MRCNMSDVLCGPFLVLNWIITVQGFSWGAGDRKSDMRRQLENSALDPSGGVQRRSRLPNVYAVAMQELHELESEPLCHRIAARLLVNNCQLLDGKDDATVLIDSGRQIRDFVDSYAASLAICDLERGSFDIPSGCAPFRESSLVRIPDSKIPSLHVSPQQIDSCLSGLARSDSAWNTWVSYRHKALRFCEAARADNDKAQSIRLHQRLTEVLSRLSEGVEQELEAHLHAINTRANEATEKLRRIVPDVDQLRNSLRDIDRTLSQDVLQVAQASHLAMQSGLQDAESLQQMLKLLVETVLRNRAELAASHETSLAVIKDRTTSEIAVVLAALSSTAASSAALQNHVELSNLRVTELTGRQKHLEQGLGRLFSVTENLSSKYEAHNEKLTQAQQMSEDLLETLDDMALSASAIRSSLLSRSWARWSPYIICPTVTLLMGSYGLAPSVVRNIGLIALGQFAGIIVSYMTYFAPRIWETNRSETFLNGANGSLSFTPIAGDFIRNFPSELSKPAR